MDFANLYFGWAWILLGLISGTILGLRFRDEKWLGGFSAWPRRLVRLGHIAFLGTGLLNIAFAISVDELREHAATSTALAAASWLFILGGVTMPAVCFASAFRAPLRALFFIPVASLVAAAVAVLLAGLLR